MPNDTADLTVFFAHSGSTRVKAVHRTLIKLSPGVNVINVLSEQFSYKILAPKITKLHEAQIGWFSLVHSCDIRSQF